MSLLEGRTGAIDWSDIGPNGVPAIVLIHSLGTDRRMWDGQLGDLTSAHRVIALDLPGHGRSVAKAGPYTLADLGRDVLDVTRACGMHDFAVAGSSLGGLIALWLAVNAPDRVSTLVACNTAARLGSPELWSDRIEAVRRGGMEAVREAVVRRFFVPGFELAQSETFRRYSDIFTATDPEGYVGCCAALRDADLQGDISSIRCRTLVVGGELDVASPPEQSRWLHRQIAGSQITIIPGAGHLSNVDHPEAFGRSLGRFLSGDH